MTWLKRGILCIGLLVLVVCGLLYFYSVAIVEAFLLPQLAERGGELEIESIRFNMEGVALRIERYEDAQLAVKGMLVSCTWSQVGLFSGDSDAGQGSGARFGGRVSVEELRLRLQDESPEAVESEAASPAESVAALVAQIDALPLRTVDVAVDALFVELPERQVLVYEAGLTFLRGASGETHLAATLMGEHVELGVKMKVSRGGSGMALDFEASADGWEAFQASYLQALSDPLAAQQVEFYLNPLAEGRGFLDVSGYVRWVAAQPDRLSFTALADFGEGEVYFPGGELILQRTSMGLTSDGMGHDRAYGKGAIDSVRVGSWMESGGDWAVRADGAKLAAELRVGDALSLSLGHDDWAQLLQGSGIGQFYLEASEVDAELLRLLELQQIPDDLVLDMALKVDGEGALEKWQPSDVSVKVDANVVTASVASQGLAAADVEALASLHISAEKLAAKSLNLSVGSLDLLGFALNDMQLIAESDAEGKIAVSPVKADFIGGILRIDPLQIDPVRLEGTTFRIGLEAVDLEQLAMVVPQFKGDVSGKLSGHLVGEFKDGQPILTDGRLEIDPDVGARLSYDVKGMLTRGMLEGSAAYKQYRMAELAFEDLALKRFSIDVFPDGNTTLPFRLKLFGESLQGKTVVPVDFNLNVNVDDTAGLLELLRMIQSGQLDLN